VYKISYILYKISNIVYKICYKIYKISHNVYKTRGITKGAAISQTKLGNYIR